MAGAQTASDARWVSSVAAEVRRQLEDRAAAVRRRGGDPSSELGDPKDLAARMVAAVPERSPWNAVGPFYSTTGVAKLLGGISRQAVEDRRRRQRLIALRTQDGTWLYPAFQFDERGRLLPPVVAAHRGLAVGRIDGWTAAASLLGPQPELHGRSIRDHLAAGLDPEPVDDLIRFTVASLA
jgi:hypothetical protein